MEWIGDLNEMVGTIGPWLTIVILLIVFFIGMIISVILMIKSLSDSVNRLADKVSAPYLQTEQSIMLFRSVMRDHIWQKLTYLGEILERNSIAERTPQIKINIEKEFRRITVQEAEKLSRYKSVCGDMGKILQKSINWSSFLATVFTIFFSHDTDSQKIKDIHVLMTCEVDKIVKIIEDNGIHN